MSGREDSATYRGPSCRARTPARERDTERERQTENMRVHVCVCVCVCERERERDLISIGHESHEEEGEDDV